MIESKFVISKDRAPLPRIFAIIANLLIKPLRTLTAHHIYIDDIVSLNRFYIDDVAVAKFVIHFVSSRIFRFYCLFYICTLSIPLL